MYFSVVRSAFVWVCCCLVALASVCILWFVFVGSMLLVVFLFALLPCALIWLTVAVCSFWMCSFLICRLLVLLLCVIGYLCFVLSFVLFVFVSCVLL